MLQPLFDDLRHGLRAIAREPRFASLIVATLSLGIGANAALFSVVDRLFLRPPAGVMAPERLRRLHVETSNTLDRKTLVRSGLDYPEFLALDSALAPLAKGTVYSPPETLSFGDDRGASMIRVTHAASSYFALLGVHPARGRFFAADEDRMGAGVPVAVLSDAFWRRSFGGDPAVIGRVIEVDRRPFTVIGIAPNGFTGADLEAADVWLPLAMYPRSPLGGRPWYRVWRSCWCLEVVERVEAAVPDAQLEARGTTLLRHPPAGSTSYVGYVDSTAILAVGPILQQLGPQAKPDASAAISLRLMGVAALVLLIACANVANLLLARGLRRRREIAIRLALGISHARLVRQLLGETVLLALLAGGVGVLVGLWSAKALRALLFPSTHWAGSAIDGRVVLFTAIVALGTGVLAGLAPALHAGRRDLTVDLKSGSSGAVTGRPRILAVLIGVQAALCVVLLAGAGLFVKSLREVRGVDVGYDVQRLVYATLLFKDPKEHYVQYGRDAELAAGLTDVAARLTRTPGVERVALAGSGPMAGYGDTRLYLPGRDSVPRLGGRPPLLVSAFPEFFATTGLRLVRGRLYAPDFPKPESGRHIPPEMVVNEAMAKTLWPGEDALGKCMIIARPTEPCTTVVGIVTDAHLAKIVEEPTMIFYLPTGRPWMLVIRAAAGRTAWVAQQVRASLRERLPSAEPPLVWVMADALASQLRPWQLGAALFGAFGALALLVAAVGMYGITSYVVAQQTRELGLRMALGARGRDVMSLVVSQGVRPVLAGVVLGSALSLAIGRAIASLLYATSPHDATVMVSVALALLVVATAASVIPGLRAVRVDPLAAIRAE